MKYKVKKLTKQIIAVVVPDRYARGMLFCRAQEFYENPNVKFRGKHFSIWDYFNWYVKTYKRDCFSYSADYVGFNVPLEVVIECYSEASAFETPYDTAMWSLATKLYDTGDSRKYLIGVDTVKTDIFEHELALAFYYVDDNYRQEMDTITAQLSKPDFNRFQANLVDLGYCQAVIMDEIQAYMATEMNKKITKGIKPFLDLYYEYSRVFKRYRKQIR
jgi:hypothetical protein